MASFDHEFAYLPVVCAGASPPCGSRLGILRLARVVLLLCALSTAAPVPLVISGGSSAILIFDVLGVWECLRALPGPLTLCGLAAPLLFLLFRPLGVCASPAMRYKRPSAEPNKQNWHHVIHTPNTTKHTKWASWASRKKKHHQHQPNFNDGGNSISE